MDLELRPRRVPFSFVRCEDVVFCRRRAPTRCCWVPNGIPGGISQASVARSLPHLHTHTYIHHSRFNFNLHKSEILTFALYFSLFYLTEIVVLLTQEPGTIRLQCCSSIWHAFTRIKTSALHGVVLLGNRRQNNMAIVTAFHLSPL